MSQSIYLIPPRPPRTRRPDDRGSEKRAGPRSTCSSRVALLPRSSEDVAKAAGVSKGLPYLYFKNKEELFKAVKIAEAIGEAAREGDRVRRPLPRLDRRLAARSHRHVSRFRRNNPLGGVIKLILAEAGNFPDVARFYCSTFELRGRVLFGKTLRRGVARGEFPPYRRYRRHRDRRRPAAGACTRCGSARLRPSISRLRPATRFYAAYLDLILKGLRS